ncbi:MULTISPECIES: winged helix-turn-helix domain-containing protein [Sulfolobaceae]|uniref:DNA-binding protein 10a n=4 Tax=Sulfurisphaera TaxID=69655 RepID=Q974K1_SULTO|nr:MULTISPECIES: winged helix-turn-helix domain-containing protein [Sulfolobaceae]MBB5252746.1 putative transcriptional regulator [Sulfurisphaera ohwakuensis]QGR16312.1 hypothetical protein D1869_03165 [Sulfurisphaera ohwakuensis]QIW23521.1 hypothetical protein EWF20_04685 [Sulfolobus sp. S-194]BAB65657.1 DNA-binding protein 10a [Sulfurisphaera tokodaii str. 7]HII74092.1 hypothetical protein [Sulfurisphaera tokodaii]
MTEAQVGRKKRTRYEIIHDILSQCENGAKKTWLMYKANLSYELTNNYINKLVEKELIVQKDGLYYLTDKGRKLLDLLKDYKEKKSGLDKVVAQIKEIYGED